MSVRIHHTLFKTAFFICALLSIILLSASAFAKAHQDGPTHPADKLNRYLPAIGNERAAAPLAIDGGIYHTCTLTASGGVKCWGYNEFGQIGDNTTGDPAFTRSLPVDVKGLTSGVQAIAAGQYHSCALTEAGGVKCWGGNNSGQLGTGTEGIPCGYQGRSRCLLVPVNVVGLSSGVQAIASYADHSCALTTAGGVKCWGRNDYGQLGDGNGGEQGLHSNVPVDVVGLSSGVVAIAVGFGHSCALTDAGGVKCWGLNSDGQLGAATDGGVCGALDSDFCHFTPVDVVAFPAGVQTLALGGGHTCVLTTMGTVKCWGGNGAGQLGDGSQFLSSATPVTPIGMSDGVRAIDAGSQHTCAITLAGAVKCWGNNGAGQLGDGGFGVQCGFMHEEHCQLEPVEVIGLSSGVVTMGTGSSHNCAIMRSDAVKCWGYNVYGQAGDGYRGHRFTPADAPWP
jgi:alpha-tubulin suppressor-like RCC1 family protein